MKNFFLFDPKLLGYGFCITFFASYGQTFFISIFNPQIRNLYNLSDGGFGLVYALGTLSSSLILVGFAKLIDHIDLRIYSLLISIGLSLSCLAMYLSNNSVIMLFFIIFGLRFFGQGAMSHAGVTTMARYFDNNRGKAISVATFGGQLGVTFMPIIAVKLIDKIGWQNVWLFANFSILIFFIPLIFIFLNTQVKRHQIFLNTSHDVDSSKKWKTREVIFDKKFYIYLPLSIAAPFISTGLMFHQVFIIGQKGWTIEMLAGGFILLGIFSLLGLVLAGPLIDKYNTKKITLFTLSPLFVALIILIFFDNYFSMFFYLSLLGFNMGISWPFLGSLWAELYGLRSIGTVKALLAASSVFSSALSPLIFGYIIDLGFGILVISTISLLIIAISTLLAIIYKDIK